jgi:hypothetical protein
LGVISNALVEIADAVVEADGRDVDRLERWILAERMRGAGALDDVAAER